MRVHQRIPARAAKGIALALGLALATHATAMAQAEPRLDATIFSYDGKDFVRTRTTLMTEDGKSAVNTKLDHSTPAYKALTRKHSYVGEVKVFGHTYDADYAPLTGKDGRLTGALFVAVEK